MRRFRWLLVLAITLLPGGAFAQDSQPASARTQASVRFNRGVELFQDQAYRAALIEFERAYEALPDYRVLWNIGRTKFELQDFLGTANAYERYLAEGGPSIPAERREEVERTLRSLASRVGRISVTVNVTGAEVFIDEAKVGVAPLANPVPVNVGRHEVTVRSPDGGSDTRTVDVAGDENASVALHIIPPKIELVGGASDAPQPFSLRKLAIVGWSVGGGLVLASVTTGILAARANSDFDALMKRADVSASSESEQRQKLKTRALLTDVFAASGAAFVAVGTILWLVDRKREKSDASPSASARIDVDVGLGSVAMRGRF